MKENYYQIIVWIKGRAKPLKGIRKYLAQDNLDVNALVRQSLLKYYFEDDILKIEIRQLTIMSVEVKEYLKKIEQTYNRKNQEGM